jgi:anaerobic selenocysteine-containing dehydrogenase
MSNKISRRDFVKLVGAGAAATAVLTGCGPASRYVTRQPYTSMPEYTYNGVSTYYATTCRECPAGCGLVVRTMQGRALKVEGNQNNPVNRGKTCARGQTILQGLYNPDRVQAPVKQARRETLNTETLKWEEAVRIVTDVLNSYASSEIAFLMGLAADHLFDLVTDLTRALHAPPPIRYGALGMFEAQATLRAAANTVFNQPAVLDFDFGGADVLFSFGANFLETWLSPVAFTRGFSQMRQGAGGLRGYHVQFESRMSQTAAVADEWVPINPGTEAFVALGLGRLVSEARGSLPTVYRDVDIGEIVKVTGVEEKDYRRLAQLFAEGDHSLAVPGGAALGQVNGLQAAEMVLALNVLVGNVGGPGGVNLTPSLPGQTAGKNPGSISDMEKLVGKMASGEIKVLFVHGVNPVFEVPKVLGFAEALAAVPLVISFSPFPDETALRSDFIFPDHTGLESWGYQRVRTGVNQITLSGAQPVVAPYYDTRATADVLLAAVGDIDGDLAAALPFDDEVAYIKDSLLPLVGEEGGVFTAPEINTFMSSFQQFGGWWRMDAESPALSAGNVLDRAVTLGEPVFVGQGEFYLHPFVSPVLGEAGANKPWLQETPDPTTTVMWNTWVEINPETAAELGLENDDVVKIVSQVGEIEASVYVYPGIRPDTIAIPFGQGHTAYGRYAQGRGANPADLFGLATNAAGDFAFAATKVKVEKTGKRQLLARLGSRLTDQGQEGH